MASAPVNWQILHGETTGGVTLHHVVKKPDAGDIVDQEAFAIGPEETGRDVYANRAVLRVHARWGRITAQEDYEDTERARAYDWLIATPVTSAPSGSSGGSSG